MDPAWLSFFCSVLACEQEAKELAQYYHNFIKKKIIIIKGVKTDSRLKRRTGLDFK